MSFLLSAIFVACGDEAPLEKSLSAEEPTIEESDEVYQRIALMPIEDHFELDSILIHNTYELSEGNFMMVSRSTAESFEGLRMHLYTLKDSLPIISSSSTPAYDSWIYLPTFFISPDEQDTLLMAEIGERESWGARLLRIENGAFVDLGFIDLAVRGTKFDEEEGMEVMVLKSIAPFTVIRSNDEVITLSFSSDSVHVFDDGLGGIDVLLPADRVRYEMSDSLRLKIENPI